jgi:hypothetical protein
MRPKLDSASDINSSTVIQDLLIQNADTVSYTAF